MKLGDTLNLIKQLMHSDVTFITDDGRIRSENSEVFRLCCDYTNIRNLTGFTPQYSLEQGLQQYIDWFARPENQARYKIDIYNV